MNNQILIIEDNIEYVEILQQVLLKANYDTLVADNAVAALELLKLHTFHLIIVDLDLGSISGFQLSELIRIDNSHTPIMLLTGSPNDDDEIKALALGIDEYVHKSVSFSVLLGRIDHTINYVARQTTKARLIKSVTENLSIDTTCRDVYKDGALKQVTTLEYDLLVYLLCHKKYALSRESLLQNVWKIDATMLAATDMRIVDTSIKNIRKKLAIHSIYTIRGVGYKWDE